MKHSNLLIPEVNDDDQPTFAAWLRQSRTGVRAGHVDASAIPFRIGLANQTGIDLIDPRTVVCVEGSRNYSLFHIAGRKPYTVSYSLGRFEVMLRQPFFMRVHKRFIVNLMEVTRYVKKGGILLMSNGLEVPLSSSKRKVFLEWLQTGCTFGINGEDIAGSQVSED